ncbi:MAG: hypothetical protein QM655_12955, partial [Nocardioidaceae bacterium]
MVNLAGRTCAWCEGPIAFNARRDALTCSKSCRQARARFNAAVGVAPVAGDGVRRAGPGRRLAYADPPYPGLAGRYYGTHPDFAGEVDHRELLAELSQFDGRALSTSARALPDVLRLCPPGVRVAAWHRGEASFAASSHALNAWEPVIYLPPPAPGPAAGSARASSGNSPRSLRDTSVEVLDDTSAEDLRDGSVVASRDMSRSAGDDTSVRSHDDGSSSS